jgi:hypothetical protein
MTSLCWRFAKGENYTKLRAKDLYAENNYDNLLNHFNHSFVVRLFYGHDAERCFNK